MDPRYSPADVETRWQETWEKEGLYAAGAGARSEQTFVVMHPPPNISGSLTIGHVLQLSLEDTLVRWHRMRGFDTLFQPGYDHAGISTWAAIGRTLAKEGKSQRDLGREGFDAYVQDWLARYGGTIMAQFRRVGASLDYGAHALHDGRRLLPRGHPLVRPPVPARLDLPRQPDLELVPTRPNRALRPRARAGGGRRHALLHPLSARRRLGARDDRDRAAGDDPRRRRGRRAPGRRAVSRSRREGGDRALRRAEGADRRGRAGGPRVRNRGAQGHARARSDGLRDRARRTGCRSWR